MTIIEEMQHGYLGYIGAVQCAFSAVADELTARAPKSIETIIRDHQSRGADGVELLEASLGTAVATLEKLEPGAPVEALTRKRDKLPSVAEIGISSRPHEIEVRNEAMRTHFDKIIDDVKSAGGF